MPSASSLGALEAMIRAEALAAMHELNSKALQDMQEETQGFYSQGSPVLYTRTGGLANSPKVTGVSGGMHDFSFQMYLDPNQGWYGKGNPNPAFTSRGYASYYSPLQILNAAEYHFAHVLGRPGFWHRSELKVERDLQRIFSSHFN